MAPKKRKYKPIDDSQGITMLENTSPQETQVSEELKDDITVIHDVEKSEDNIVIPEIEPVEVIETENTENVDLNDEIVEGENMYNSVNIETPVNLKEEIKPTVVVNDTDETVFVNGITTDQETTKLVDLNNHLVLADPSIIIEFDNVMDITYINQQTNTHDKIVAYNKELKLTLGRHYLLPITNKTISSDDYKHIKTFSNISGKLDIRYIKNGIAYVIPLINNIIMSDGERLAYLSN